MMKHYKSFLIMFFLFSSFSLLQVMGDEKQTVVPKPFAEFLSENMKKTDGVFPVYQEGLCSPSRGIPTHNTRQ